MVMGKGEERGGEGWVGRCWSGDGVCVCMMGRCDGVCV